MLASAEIRKETQPQSVTGTFQAPGPGDENIKTYGGGLVISGDRRPRAIEDVNTEMPTTNTMATVLNSIDTVSSMVFPERSEEIGPERATAESSWPHRFASASASASSGSPPQHIVIEATRVGNSDELSNLEGTTS